MSNTANGFDNVELLIDNYLTAQNAEPKDALMQAITDPRFEAAVKAITEQKGKPTAAYLQRKLKVGYAIAATFLDAMEALGLVSPVRGMQPREVLPAAKEYLAHLSAK
jgi:DNA segregation ATPase FtsK/SpoIIIE-like protein